MKHRLMAVTALVTICIMAWSCVPIHAKALVQADPQKVEQRFRNLDGNSDGILTADETDRPMLFRRIDTNGDGRLTLGEVQAFYGNPDDAQPTPRVASGPQRLGTAMVPHRNLRYGETAGVAANLQSLDVYSLNDGRPHPVLVFIHGGGWAIGDKSHVKAKPGAFTQQGYVFVSVNYRLSPAVKHPAHIQDIARAIAWVRKNIGDHGGDPKRIFVMGHSAGAHLAALVAIDARYLKVEGMPLAALSGAILLDGAGYDIPRRMKAGGLITDDMFESAFGTDPEIWKDASPLTHVASGTGIPPFLIFHAGNRKPSRELAGALAEALRGAGVSTDIVHAPDKNHASLNQDLGFPGDVPTAHILTFLKECVATGRATNR